MSLSVQRGVAAAKAGNVAEAADWFAKALTEHPGDIQAKAYLGQSLCSLGRRIEGINHLREAGTQLLEAAKRTSDIRQVLELVQQLHQWTDFVGACDIGKEAVTIAAADVRGWQQLAVSCAQLNRRQEAVDAARRALELAPDNGMIQVFLGSLEADAGLNDVARDRLERALAASLQPREQFRAHKELARVLDKLGAHDEVFAQLHASARVAQGLQEYRQQNLALLPGLIRSNKAGFDRELLGRWASANFSGPPAPTFLVGFFRSGTTLTQEVLAAHPGVFVADEADFIWATQRELHQMDNSALSTAEKLRKLDQTGIQRLRDFYWDRVDGRFGDDIGERSFVDKFTLNTVDLGLINVVFPDARIIFAMRDPRDVCLSCFMQLLVPTPATVHLLTWPGTIGFYAQVMDWWLHIRQQMTLACHEFRYEDAVSDFETTFRRMFGFLGLDWDPGVAEFHKRAAERHIASPSRTQVAQPLYASSVARWRHYEREFESLVGPLRPFIEAYGYEAA